MGVDHVDLIQLHNLVEPDEWEVALGPGGAVEALAAARDEGLVRFIGVTGHGLRIADMHLRSLERFDFDSVLLPYNFSMMQIPEYRADVEALRSTCAPSATSPCRRSSRSPARRWPDDRRRTSAGTSRSPTPMRSTAPSASCSATRPVPQHLQRRPAAARSVRRRRGLARPADRRRVGRRPGRVRHHARCSTATARADLGHFCRHARAVAP